MKYSNTKEFERDLKHLLKKLPTLEEDLKIAKKNAIELLHIYKINNNGIFPIPKHCSEKIQIYKIKKFACKSLKGEGCQSGIRVIYAFYPDEQKVEFIEIYYKKEKENMDYTRAKTYLKNILAK